MERILFPSWRFHVSGDTARFPDRLVRTADEADALGPDWTNGDVAALGPLTEVRPGEAPKREKVLYPSTRFHQGGYSRVVPNAEVEAVLLAEGGWSSDPDGPFSVKGGGAPLAPAAPSAASELPTDGPTPEEPSAGLTPSAEDAYDSKILAILEDNVADVVATVATADVAVPAERAMLVRARDLEIVGKNRKGVVSALEAALAQ